MVFDRIIKEVEDYIFFCVRYAIHGATYIACN